MKPKKANPKQEESFDKILHEKENAKLKIYPNPSNGRYYVDNVSANSKCILYDQMGREMNGIISRTGKNTISINISDSPKGLYLLKVIHSDGNSSTY